MITGKIKKPRNDRKLATATSLRFRNGHLIVALSDGREISVPLKFYPTLTRATPTQRSQWELIGEGRGISWESLDLDLSVQGLLDGAHEAVPKPPVANMKSPNRTLSS